MVNLVSMYPKSWVTDVTRERGGGRNADGDYVKPTKETLGPVLVASRATAEPEDRKEVAITTAVMYGDSEMDVLATDVFVVPATHRMKGRWAVDGDPSFWPLGTEVPLRRL